MSLRTRAWDAQPGDFKQMKLVLVAAIVALALPTSAREDGRAMGPRRVIAKGALPLRAGAAELKRRGGLDDADGAQSRASSDAGTSPTSSPVLARRGGGVRTPSFGWAVLANWM